MKTEASPTGATAFRAVVIGDLVSSRDSADRSELHRSVVDVLARAESQVPAVSPLRVTVGDEFQGAYAGLGAALRATLWVRLSLLTASPSTDVRFGVAWGEARDLDAAAGIEDGPAWWAAREAIDAVESEASRAGTRLRRTAYRVGEGSSDAGAHDPALVEALLICRDELVGSLSARSVRLLLGMLEGRSQLELAEAEEISASAVSQRVRADGLAALVASERRLGEMR